MKQEVKVTDEAGNIHQYDVIGQLPTVEDLDNAAIEFVNSHLTQETECFDAGDVWMLRASLLDTSRVY